MDNEKIILGLKHCIEDNCDDCPYYKNTTKSDCLKNLHADILKCIEKFKHMIK